MRSVIMHKGIFSTRRQRGLQRCPEALLRTLGDIRYANFVSSQSAECSEMPPLRFTSCAHAGFRARVLENCEALRIKRRGSKVSVTRPQSDAPGQLLASEAHI